MKRFWIIILLSAGVVLPAASPVRLDEKGVLSSDALKFRLFHHAPAWKNRSLWKGGDFPVFSGTFQVSVQIEETGGVSCTVGSDYPTKTQFLGLQTVLPEGCEIRIDGKPFAFGPSLHKKRWIRDFNDVAKLEILTENSTVVIKGKFPVQLVDERMFGQAGLGLRLPFSPREGDMKRAVWNGRFSRVPVSSIPLDLRGAATFGFRDRVAWDGKGGWTDQGAMNDMSALPVGKKLKVKGLDFEIIDPETNGGRGCVALQCPKIPNLPVRSSADYSANPPSGKYLYLLHALAWTAPEGTVVGEAACSMKSGAAVEKQTLVFPIISGEHVSNFWMPRELSKGLVGWSGRNASATVGLYLTRLELTGEPLEKLTFTSRNQCNWIIVGATLSDRRIDPVNVRPVTVRADADWMPIHNKTEVVPGSALDFSGMALDAPAGKYGFVTVRNGRLELEKQPGKPFRFYGTNIVYWTHFLSRKQADSMVEHLAATGYNILRLHMFDLPQLVNRKLEINPAELDKLEYLIAACKKRGIYLTMDLFGTRGIPKGVLPGFEDRGVTLREFKALMLIDDGAMRNYETFVRNLMNHRNPHTGLTWREDPVFATISIANEGTIFCSWNRSEATRKIYEKAFEEYRKGKKGTSGERDLEWKKFLLETYARAYRRYARLLKEELGVKAPLTDQNFSSSVPLTLLRNQLDVVDNHAYWAHPVFPKRKFNSFPAVVMNESAVSRNGGAIGGLFPTRIFGKPFTVTEWDYVNPNCFNAEGAFLTGAYAALQDWSGLCRFSYNNDRRELFMQETPLSYFQAKNDPVRMLSERAGVLFFLRGDVAPSDIFYPFQIDENDLKNEEFPGTAQLLGLLGQVGSVVGNAPLPEKTKAVLSLRPRPSRFPNVAAEVPREDLKNLQTKNLLPANCGNFERDQFRSSTGELTLDANRNTFCVVTPRSEGFVVQAGKSVEGKFAVVEHTDTFSAILTAAIDHRELADSRRILILHLTDSKNSGQTFTGPDMNTCTDPGGLPVLVRRGKAELTLRRAFPAAYKAYALDVNGKRLFELPLNTENGFTKIRLCTDRNGTAVCAYEITR